MNLLKELVNEKDKQISRKMVIIRHGQTALNRDDRIRGWSDIPLDAVGEEQAESLGRKLKGKGVDMLVASDLTRTLQTAKIVSRESGIPIIRTTTALRPWNVGKYTSQPVEKVHPILKKMAMETPEDPIEGGESFDSFKFRVLVGTIAFMNEYPDKLIGFVCHHRNDRIFRGWVEAGCPDDFEIDFEHFFQHGIDPGTADVIEVTSKLLI